MHIYEKEIKQNYPITKEALLPLPDTITYKSKNKNIVTGMYYLFSRGCYDESPIDPQTLYAVAIALGYQSEFVC